MDTIQLSDTYSLQIKTEDNEVKARVISPAGAGFWHTIRSEGRWWTLRQVPPPYPEIVDWEISQENQMVSLRYRDNKRQNVRWFDYTLAVFAVRDDEGIEQ